MKNRFPLIWNKARNVDQLRSAYAYVKSVGAIGGYVLGNPPPVLVCQMGSVGSRSLYMSLRQFYSGLVHHTHDLRPGGLSSREKPIYKWCVKGPVETRIISLVRDPIAHNISRLFQNFERYIGATPEKYEGGIERIENVFMEKLNHDYPINWFSRWKNDLGIDVYQYETNNDKYQKINKENMKVIIMRTETKDEEKKEIISKNLGIDNFRIKRKNEGSKKKYAEIYSKFKDNFVAPRWYLQKMYESRFFTHFYPKKYEKRFKDRWAGNTE